MSRKSTMEQPEYATVICIPHNYMPLRRLRVPVEAVANLGASTGQSFKLDNYLRYVPNIIADNEDYKYDDWKAFAWEHRLLVDLGNLEPKRKPEEKPEEKPVRNPEEKSPPLGPYFMYKCCTEDVNCPENKYFQKIKSKYGVYGSVFIFKVNQSEFKDGRMGKFEDLEVKTLQCCGVGENHILEPENLKWLATLI